jgi:hypothetical protein
VAPHGRAARAAHGDRARFALCSFPKSGRTWLRFILASYFRRAFDLDVTVDLHTLFTLLPNDDDDPARGRAAFRYAGHPQVPLILSSHSDYCPELAHSAIIFIARNIYDTVVSYDFHMSKQVRVWEADLPAFLRGDEGLTRLVAYYNSWSDRLAGRRSLVLAYEGLHADAPGVVARVLSFVGIRPDAPIVAQAVADSSFERMREVELERGIAGLRYDPSERDARRVRVGQVGGYRGSLSEGDCRYIKGRCLDELTPAARRLLRDHGLEP